MKRIVPFLIFVLVSFSVHSQQIDYLNKFKVVIQDTSRYHPHFYRVTQEDSLQILSRTYRMDSTLEYESLEVFATKKNQESSKSIRYNESGQQTEIQSYYGKNDRLEIINYFESGKLESEIVEEKGKTVSEKYYSEEGKKVAKPKIVECLPAGGIAGWNTFLGQNLIYPESARRMQFEGVVYLVFIVNEVGEMEEIELMNPEENHFLLNQEAKRVVSIYPYQWSPMTLNGIAKRSRMRLPIRFKLTD